MHIGYADRLDEVICQGQHLLETDLFESVNVQSVAHVCELACASMLVCACVHALGKNGVPQFHHSCLAASFYF